MTTEDIKRLCQEQVRAWNFKVISAKKQRLTGFFLCFMCRKASVSREPVWAVNCRTPLKSMVTLVLCSRCLDALEGGKHEDPQH